MKNHLAIKCIAFLTVITLLSSCAEPTTIGSELQETVDAFSTDTISLRMTTVVEDNLEIFTPDPTSAYSTFLCGNYNDDILGKTSASIFTQLRVSSGPDTFFNSNFAMTVLDSVVLHLPYDFSAMYGDEDEEYTFEVFRMTEGMSIGDTYYTNTTFEFDPSPIGQITFNPPNNPEDSIKFTFPTSNTEVTVQQHLRIPMDLSFGQEFLDLAVENETLEETTELQEFLKGLHIRSVNEDAGMVALSLNQQASISSVGAELTFYYHYNKKNFNGTSDTTVYKEYSLLTSSSSDQYIAKTTNAVAEFSPEVENAVDKSFATGDELLYAQGLIGPFVKFEIPYADAFKNTIINKAELVLTVASPLDTTKSTPFQVTVATRSEDGTYLVTDDVLFAISRGNFALFGGREVEENGLRQYSFNLSAVFQELADVKNESLYLQIFLKEEQVSRMTLYGPEHSQFPAKLNLVYTKLPQ